jgi:bacillopeptidase F
MSRLLRSQKRKFYQQLTLSLVLLTLIIIFFATLGLKLLISTSLFIARFSFNKKTTQNTTADAELLLPPEIIGVPDATNSAELAITGRAQPKKNLSVFVNGDKVKEVLTDKAEFRTVVTLDEGVNEIYLEVEEPEKKLTKKSASYYVTYKNEPLVLNIDTPTDGSKTASEEISVSGTVDSDAIVKINGLPVVSSGSGAFSGAVKLKEGENKISVEASDRAGNYEKKEITVFYERE